VAPLAFRSARTVVIVLLLVGLFFGYSATLPSASAKLTQLHSHYFAKWRLNPPCPPVCQYIPVNITNTFAADDVLVAAFMNASYPTPTNLTSVWYDPTGALYDRSSDVWTCYLAYCVTFGYQIINDTRMARMPGVWRYDHFADGVLLYSDRFTLTPAIFQQFSPVFRLDLPTHARVDFTVTVHPKPQVLDKNGSLDWTIGNLTEWSPNLGGTGISNISARDYKTNESVMVTPREAAADRRLHVYFGGPRGDGYTFVLSFDLVSPFIGYSATDGVYWLKWAWGVVGGIESIPQQVTVVLPQGFSLKDIAVRQNDTVRRVQRVNYTTSLRGGRMSISFSAPISYNSLVEWTVEYVPSGSNTTIVSSKILQSTSVTTTSGSQIWMSVNSALMLGLALAVIAVAAGWWIMRRRQR
jgi:hypothetical protein